MVEICTWVQLFKIYLNFHKRSQRVLANQNPGIQLTIDYGYNRDKRASLACAARLADTACPQIYPVGAWGY